jgi:hypothetical protein
MSRRMRRSTVAAALSIALIAGGFVYLRGGSTPVSVDSAVERFRESLSTHPREEIQAVAPGAQASSPAEAVRARSAVQRVATEASDGGRPLPAEGVYRYATTGGDEVDVLGGSRHAYPAETTITISHGGCGLVERWDALEERWDERESCRTPAGQTLKRMTAFHEFFGHADRRTLHCSGYTYPAGFDPGSSWTTTCASDNTKATTTLTAVGWEDLEVDGVGVRTMHVNAKTTVHGEQEGTSERDVWGSADFGLVVRERVTLTSYSTQPVFGRTRYHESYDLQLASLEPRR